MPAVLNASNEIAVSKFISGKIKFLDISRIIEKTMNAYTVKYNCSLDDIFEADRWAREYADNLNV
ncbi:1-deoxy-D-xylulose 5-phosphate reductoisomerase [bioreactor metagenome]|uniref:1-deoxy-D-xylulose 5-phosphate reductoisomerase n=1 Tax=bioreactor metagenome TaxID=1076179 RepID=A0A645H9Y7_9ZZZZ